MSHYCIFGSLISSGKARGVICIYEENATSSGPCSKLGEMVKVVPEMADLYFSRSSSLLFFDGGLSKVPEVGYEWNVLNIQFIHYHQRMCSFAIAGWNLGGGKENGRPNSGAQNCPRTLPITSYFKVLSRSLTTFTLWWQLSVHSEVSVPNTI